MLVGTLRTQFGLIGIGVQVYALLLRDVKKRAGIGIPGGELTACDSILPDWLRRR